MLIKNDQISNIQRISDEQLQIKILKFIAENYPEEIRGFEIDILIDMVDTGIHRGRHRGLTLQNTITTFVTWMFIVAPNFDEHKIINSILLRESWGEEFKIKMISKIMNAADWEQAVKSYKKDAWLINYD